MSESPEAFKVLSDWANGKIHDWLDLMDAGDYTEAAELTVAAIREHCRRVDMSASLTVRRFHFGIRVVLNGLRDLANFKIIVGDDRWIASPKSIERVWNLAHDAQDRLSGYSGLDSEFVESCRAISIEGLLPVAALVMSHNKSAYLAWKTGCRHSEARRWRYSIVGSSRPLISGRQDLVPSAAMRSKIGPKRVPQ